jgi:hypothetical protein
VIIVKSKLAEVRALLFWAAIGMGKSRGGQYEDELEHILESYAEAIGFKFDRSPAWGSMLAPISKTRTSRQPLRTGQRAYSIPRVRGKPRHLTQKASHDPKR